MLRKLYDWTMEKAAHRHAVWWLALFAFVEASFFPIPPHPLLGLMCLCALGDHFQHEVYAQPEASPAERHAMWHRLEQRYAPWLDWGDLAYPAAGGAWQPVLHFFLLPFYFIDYALAQCCALQFWMRARHDERGAMDDYMALCARLGIERCVVVQPTTYGLDNRCTLEAMAAFGPNARGVAVVDEQPDLVLDAAWRGLR